MRGNWGHGSAGALSAPLYTDDLRSAFNVSRQLRAGAIFVNCFLGCRQAVPFQDPKQAGFGGRENSLFSHDQYVRFLTIWMQLR